MDFIFLKTDILFFLVLMGTVGYVVVVLRDDNLRSTWRRVFQRPLAASAALIFSIYILIAALDSIHFKMDEQGDVNSGEILSVLDLFLWDLKTNVEKTYSAPFAYRSFSKETSQLENGQIVRDFPRLFHGGSHLKNPEKNHISDIAYLTAKGLMLGLASWLIVVGIFFVVLRLGWRWNILEVIIKGGVIIRLRVYCLLLGWFLF